MLLRDPLPYSAQNLPLQTSSLSVLDLLSFEKGSWVLSHSRCIQCLALSKALKCKTDGGANKDQRQQPCPSGLLSSHARRCCHSESRPCRFHAHAYPPLPHHLRATNSPRHVTAPLCQCLTSTLTHRVISRQCVRGCLCQTKPEFTLRNWKSQTSLTFIHIRITLFHLRGN